MLNGITQRNQSAETDAAQEDRTVAEFTNEKPKCFNLIALADEELRLVRGTLTKKVERCDAESPAGECVAIGRSQL